MQISLNILKKRKKNALKIIKNAFINAAIECHDEKLQTASSQGPTLLLE